MQSLATSTRIKQIVTLIAISFVVYQFTNWQEGIWILISTVVCCSPFSTFLSFEKARNRFLGTFIGLILAAILEYYLRFNPSQLPVIATIIVFIVGFMATKSYFYFVMVITVTVCLGFTYMNMPFTSFEPASFLFARGMGVFTGIVIFYFTQRFIFGNDNSKIELLEESYNVLISLEQSLANYLTNPSTVEAFKCSSDINGSSTNLNTFILNAPLVFNSVNRETIYAKQVSTLCSKAIKLLVDSGSVESDRVEKLLNIVRLKLDR